MKNNSNLLKIIRIFVAMSLLFYVFRVYKIRAISGEWHLNIFAYYGNEQLLMLGVVMLIAYFVGNRY